MGGGRRDGRGLRLTTRPTLQVGWMAPDAGAGDGQPPERSWEVEDDDNSKEVLADDMECADEGLILEGCCVSRVELGGGPRWERRL
jgi:hypothetical protein